MKPCIAVTTRLPEPVELRLERDYRVRRRANGADIDWPRLTEHADAVLCTPADRVSAQVISQFASSVRMIATFSVGHNHIDLTAAAARGLAISNTPDVLTDATAEIAMLLLLGAARRAAEGESLMRRRAWTGWTPTQLLGVQLSGKALGILGLGRIGRAVASRAIAFGMTIHYLRGEPYGDLAFSAVHHAHERTFWPACEFVSLHLSLNAGTRHYLNVERIAQLPRGAIVVNTARGEVVDDDAVIEALRSGQLAAAGLDVFTGEPAFRPEYADLPNTFLLPHLGSATLETRSAMGFRALDNLDAFFAGRVPPDSVPVR